MLQRAKILRKDKKGISVMVGYILLISAAIVLSVIAYQWLKTYVPKEDLECPDSVSIYIKDYSCSTEELNITLRNNGNFNVSGYYIRATTDSEQKTATEDLSRKLVDGSNGFTYQNSVIFINDATKNSMGPGREITNVFNISAVSPIYILEVIPIRFQEEENKIRLVSCGNKKVLEELTCN